MEASERIIVALDTNAEQARSLALQLEGKAKWLKVGMTLYYSAGPSIVKEFKEMGFKVFVDLKLHDIPHQVRGAAEAVAQAGADMLTVHASGGEQMLKAALEGAEAGSDNAGHSSSERPICLAITALTSLDDEVLASIGVSSDMATQVERLALLAQKAGMDGIVCSPIETRAIRSITKATFTVVTPGVRPAGTEQGDQARVATPASALQAGADYLVIGRPITGAASPSMAFEAIVKEIQL